MNDPTQAVILAAGKGTRLKDVGADKPKALLRIAGVPLIDHVRTSLASVGVTRVLVVVSHFAEQIEVHLKEHPIRGQKAQTVWQPVPQGTGQAMELAVPDLKPGPVWITYADVLTDPAEYARMLETFRTEEWDALLGVVSADQNPCHGAAVLCDEDLEVDNVVADLGNKHPEALWLSAGIFIVQPSLFPHLDAVLPSSRGEFELGDAVAHLIQGGGEVHAHPLRSRWGEVVTQGDIERVEGLMAKLKEQQEGDAK